MEETEETEAPPEEDTEAPPPEDTEEVEEAAPEEGEGEEGEGEEGAGAQFNSILGTSQNPFFITLGGFRHV